MEIKQRKTVFKELNSNLYGEGSFLEVTEWTNGEGWDVTLEANSRCERIALSYDVVDELFEMILHLRNN